jgi:hypothetical protein
VPGLSLFLGADRIDSPAVPIAVPPVLLIALLLALLGTQTAYLLAPRTPPYLVRLGLSVVAVTLGEALGRLGVAANLAVGELHPVTDLVLLAVLQWAGTRWPRQPAV